MSHSLSSLQPELLWKHFYGLTQIPRPSKKEEKVLAYLKSVIEGLGHSWEQDATGNLVVRKPATPGYESAPTVLIQGHVDMVCEKNKGTEHDFENDPIRTRVDGDWVVAEGTTLGADNGIGVAAGLAVLEASDLVHPPMEFLFTVDEETGLTGAKGLRPGLLSASIMLNLDSEEDGALYVGCSGGMDTAGSFSVEWEALPAGRSALQVSIGGLKGGHSGLDIHTGRGNAIKMLTRFLTDLFRDHQMDLASISGGSKRNAIPREAEAVVILPSEAVNAVQALATDFEAMLKNECGTVEPGLTVSVTPIALPETMFSHAFTRRLLHVLLALPHGVKKMSADIPGLVETSTNLATVTLTGSDLVIGTSQRSSVESEKHDVVRHVAAVFSLAGADISYGDGYPGWKPNMNSRALHFTRDAYQQLYGAEPEIKAIHAGLECGLIGEVYPGMDMISFGPTIEGAHSPDERLHIPTTAKFWDLLVRVLGNVARSTQA